MDIDLDNMGAHDVDSEKVVSHIQNFADSCEKAYETFSITGIILPNTIENVVLIGMGGSGMANDMVASLLGETVSMPVESIHDYNIPKYVDAKTLVVLTSYSGDTAEPISAFEQAKAANAKMVVVTSGGKLQSLAKENENICLDIDYKSQPRFALPYMFMAVYCIFEKMKLVDKLDMANILIALKSCAAKCDLSVDKATNDAKILAMKLAGKIPVVWADEKMYSVGVRFKTDLNETAKNFAFCEQLPELNHNAIAGIVFPKNAVHILQLSSNFASTEIATRHLVSAEILKNNAISSDMIKFVGTKTRVEEMLLGCLFFDWVSYYVAILNQQDPSDIANVKYLKGKL
ncbi:MAG: bifunctional phosphoglucose/phosphomannose isomerase [Candidatus Berkelbacteria bacterium]